MTPNKKLSVVVEGRHGCRHSGAILPRHHTAQMRFFAGQGRIGLASVGRNILVHEGGAVLIVQDGDTLNRARAEEDESLTRLALRNMAPNGVFDAFAFVPEIEVLFFEMPDTLEQLLGEAVPNGARREGLLAPKQILSNLLGENKPKLSFDRFLANMKPQHAETFRKRTQMGVLMRKIDNLFAATLASDRQASEAAASMSFE